MSSKVDYKSIWVVGLLSLAATMTKHAEALSCMEAITKLMPCQPYLLGSSIGVTALCCEGVDSLNQLVGSSRDELKTICKCLKQAAASVGVIADRAKQIPQLCRITVPVPIDPDVNCDSI